MTFGAAGKEGARVHDLKDVAAILDVFQKHGHSEVCELFFDRQRDV
jgi:aflatoxin B1 aldehyde reductase